MPAFAPFIGALRRNSRRLRAFDGETHFYKDVIAKKHGSCRIRPLIAAVFSAGLSA
jgi:hypothetical protein